MKNKITIYYDNNMKIFNGFSRIKKENSKGYIEVTEEEYNKTFMFPGNKEWVIKNEELILEDKQNKTKNDIRLELQSELDEIQIWFYENDWIINKVFLGEWDKTDTRYTTYLSERSIKRNRHDEILIELNI